MKSVTVLLSTYNGEKYLNEQLESLGAQVNVDLKILVRDDGSSDQTTNILNKWKKAGLLEWYQGENLKSALSFMDLVYNAPESDYYAFCDQDDVWDSNKLESAINFLDNLDQSIPALYCSNTRLVDNNLETIKTSSKRTKISLGSALLVNPAIGCTMVFNKKLKEYLNFYVNSNLHMHDAWIYRVCFALNGNIIFDEIPHISYRQHGENVVGGNTSYVMKAKRRILDVTKNKKRIRETDAKNLLEGYADLMDISTLNLVKKVAYYRESITNKMRLLLDHNIRTNSLEHNFAFFIGVILDSL